MDPHDFDDETNQPPEGLLDSILEATSGPACPRAEEQFCRGLDGELDDLDTQLLNEHADACEPCGALRSAFALLAEELTALRELDPGAEFTAGVLARTSHAAPPVAADLLGRLWKTIVHRPRFAWEAAYVGAMLFWLVLGTPGLPLEAVRSMREPVSSLGKRAWSSAQDGWQSSVTRLQADLAPRVESGRRTVEGLTEDARKLVDDFIRKDDEPEQGQE